MIRVDVKLLEEQDAASQQSNQVAKHSADHLRYLIGNRKCRKHPSNNNKIRVIAVKNGDPTMEIMSMCCTDFYKRLK